MSSMDIIRVCLFVVDFFIINVIDLFIVLLVS